jgi:hypothetical protein
MSFLGAKEEIVGVCSHGILAGLQGDQLLRHILAGRVNRNIPVQPIHLEGLLNVLHRGREQA